MYSKMHQNKNAFKLVVNLKWVKCPVCKKNIALEKVDGELLCECGYVYQTSYNYVAGIRINTDLSFKVKKIKKEES